MCVGQMSYMKLHAKESAQETDSLEDNEDSEDGVFVYIRGY